MKKVFFMFSAIAAITLASCGSKPANTEQEAVPEAEVVEKVVEKAKEEEAPKVVKKANVPVAEIKKETPRATPKQKTSPTKANMTPAAASTSEGNMKLELKK